MEAKTQMRTGLWGTMLLLIFYISQTFYQWQNYLLEYCFFLFVLPSLFCSIYIFSIMRKNLKICNIIYCIWWFYAAGILSLIAINLIIILYLGGEVVSDEISYVSVLRPLILIFLYFALPYGVAILIMRTGLRGLEHFIKTNKGLKNEDIKQP